MDAQRSSDGLTLASQRREVLVPTPTLLAYLVGRLALVEGNEDFRADALRRGLCPRFGARPAPLTYVGVKQTIIAKSHIR